MGLIDVVGLIAAAALGAAALPAAAWVIKTVRDTLRRREDGGYTQAEPPDKSQPEPEAEAPPDTSPPSPTPSYPTQPYPTPSYPTPSYPTPSYPTQPYPTPSPQPSSSGPSYPTSPAPSPPTSTRHVNAYVAERGTVNAVTRPLTSGLDYDVLCAIGTPDPRSLLTPTTGSAFPGHLLPTDAPALQAVLYVRGAPRIDPVPLEVPAFGDSAQVRLPLPRRPEGATIHAELALYYGVVAVHVQALTIPVGGPPERGGPTAELLYTLTQTFGNLGRLAARQASIIVSGPPASPEILVNGVTFAPNAFTAEAKLVDDAARAARQRLHNAQFHAGGDEPRYSRGYTKSYDDLVTDLRQLAHLGAKLAYALFSRHEAYGSIADLVRHEAAGRDRPPILQVVGLGERPAPIPWTVLYDLPLGGNPARYQPCRSIAEFGPGGSGAPPPLACPYEDDHREGGRWKPDQLCPWGFWGMSSIIEHPPHVQGRDLDLVVADRDLPVSILMADSAENLDAGLAKEHVRDLTRMLGPAFARPAITTIDALRDQLAGETMDVVYLYSHCGFDMVAEDIGFDLYLSMYGDRLTPMDIAQWTQTFVWPDPHWPARHPLVVLNGCHTTEIVTGTFTSFVTSFTNLARAAGVIGTEIKMGQGLAGWAMSLFLAELVRGVSVGEALRATRWAMFAHGNLMGLAYTPHCLAELTLRRATPGGGTG